MGLSPFV